MPLDAPLYPTCPTETLEAARLGVPMRRTSWSAWDALWAMIGAFVIANVVAVVLLALGVELDGGWLLLATAVPWIALAGWPLWITRQRGNGAQVDLGLRMRGADLWMGLLGGLAAIAAGTIAGLITVALLGDFTSAAGSQAEDLAKTSGVPMMAVFALMVAVCAPVAEELTFRGLLWSGLAKRGLAPWVSTLVSAAAFALIHFEPSRLLVLITIGTVLGVVRWRTGSLGACIVAHSVNNLPGAIGIFALAFGHG